MLYCGLLWTMVDSWWSTIRAMVVYGGLLAVNWATAQCRRAQGPQFGAVVVEIT